MESQLEKLKGNHQILEKLKKYEEAGANLLIPSIIMETGIDGILKPVIEIVQLSSLCDKKKKDDGDVYPQHPAFAISGQGLFKLSSAACVEWNYQASERTANERNFTAYQAVGGIRKADGKLYPMYAERDIDMITTEDDIRRKNETAKYKKSEADIQKEIAQIRKFKLPTTQTKAQNAVIRKLLGVKTVYTKAEIDKPFVLLRFSYQPDMSNKDITMMLMQQFIGASRQIYGGVGDAKQIDHEPVIDIEKAFHHAEEVKPDPVTDEKAAGKEETPATNGNNKPPTREEVFEGLNKAEKVEQLIKGMEQKGYEGKATEKSVETFSDKQLLGFFKVLDEMPDKETEDEIPF